MTDVRTELRRSAGSIGVPDRSFERLVERRDRRRRRTRERTIVVALGMTAVSLSALAILRLGLLGPPAPSGSDRVPTRALGLEPGDYLYLRITSSDLGDGYVRNEETWWGTDGSGEVRNRSTRRDKYPDPPSGSYDSGEFPVGHDVSSLSITPSVLAEQLRSSAAQQFGNSDPGSLWDVIGGVLFESPTASPELRAAVFVVAANLDDVRRVDGARDPVGRPAVRLRFSDPDHGRWDMFFDPGTHQAIAWTFRSNAGGEEWLVIDTAIVDLVGVRPHGDQWLAPPSEPAGR
jgi:hypothetical protein